MRGGANIVNANEPFVQAQEQLDGTGPSLSLGHTDNDDSRSLLLGPESLLESESLAASSMLDLYAQFPVVVYMYSLSTLNGDYYNKFYKELIVTYDLNLLI